MSWWIGVEGVGTPEDEISRNVTYNVGGMFRLALAIPEPGVHTSRCRHGQPIVHRVNGEWVSGVVEGCETGLPALHGAPCVEAAGVIAAALRRMADDPAPYRAMNPANGWGSFDSAVEDLLWLLEQCSRHPEATVYVH